GRIRASSSLTRAEGPAASVSRVPAAGCRRLRRIPRPIIDRAGRPGLGADNHTMTRIREEVSIAAPPPAVWAAVHEDLDNAQRWAGYVRHAEALPGRPGGARRVRHELDRP